MVRAFSSKSEKHNPIAVDDEGRRMASVTVPSPGKAVERGSGPKVHPADTQ